MISASTGVGGGPIPAGTGGVGGLAASGGGVAASLLRGILLTRGASTAEAIALVCGRATRQAGGAFAGRAEAGMALDVTSGCLCTLVLSADEPPVCGFGGCAGRQAGGSGGAGFAEDPPAAAVEELATAEALWCAQAMAQISSVFRNLPPQAASGFCQSGAKGRRP